ncbi:MAG TPA: hypothetical protein VF733_01395 [Candidatus Saccharimonadales bacterium]
MFQPHSGQEFQRPTTNEAMSSYEFGQTLSHIQSLNAAIEQGGIEGACREAGALIKLKSRFEVLSPGNGFPQEGVRLDMSRVYTDDPDFLKKQAEEYAFAHRSPTQFEPEGVTPATYFEEMSKTGKRGINSAQERATKFYIDANTYRAAFAAMRVGSMDVAKFMGTMQFYPPDSYYDKSSGRTGLAVGVQFDPNRREEMVRYFEENGYRQGDQPPIITALAKAYLKASQEQKTRFIEDGSFAKLQEYFSFNDADIEAIAQGKPMPEYESDKPAFPAWQRIGRHIKAQVPEAELPSHETQNAQKPSKTEQIHLAQLAIGQNEATLRRQFPDLAPHVSNTLERLKRLVETGNDLNPDVKLANNPVQARIIRLALDSALFDVKDKDTTQAEAFEKVLGELGEE